MEECNTKINIFWFRRDLRLHDNHGLWQALNSGLPILPLFIFDTEILEKLENKKDRRVEFIHNSLLQIESQLNSFASGLKVMYGKPLDVYKKLCSSHNIGAVYTNNDYEQYAIDRDKEINMFLSENGISFLSFKDQVIFEKNEVIKDDGNPYTVFTPYSKKWKLNLQNHPFKIFDTSLLNQHFFKTEPQKIPSLNDIGFEATDYHFPSQEIESELVVDYKSKRDIPSLNATSKLSIHLRFGTISIRQLVTKAIGLSETFLNELIWRDFYQMILWQFPHINKGRSFKKAYDNIEWRNNLQEFKLWCEGKTGYPIVDAGMRELNSTGFMHNRVRMITASFLCKHLLIDWRWGESYFASQLLDFDFASNNGGWQWAAGSGCDAAPYFRIFNPYLQTKKFDSELNYIRKWVPEFESLHYSSPIVEHDMARRRCLDVYKKALREETPPTL
jgi:deoxyribodipyrimidine photo-lyase